MRAALVLLFLFGSPADAQGDRCQAEWDQIRDIFSEQFGAEIVAGAVREDGDGCVASSVTQLGQDRVVPAAREVRWQGQGLDSFAETGVLPERIIIEARKVAAVPVFEHSPALSWVYKVQSLRTGVDVVLDLGLDRAAGTMDLERLSFDFPSQNRVELQAKVTGADLTDMRSLRAGAGNMALESYQLRVESFGLFETFVLPTLGPVLFDGVEDPGAELLRMKALAIGWVALLPGELLDGPSRDALIQLIEVLPHPNGVLEVNMEADPPLGAERGLVLAMDPDFDPLRDVARLMEGVTLTVIYDHTPFEP